MGNHRVQEMMRLMASKIREIANTISDEESEKFIQESAERENGYTLSGPAGLPCCKGVCHAAHAPGSPCVCCRGDDHPCAEQGDVMVIFSGSGRTKTVADLAETARDIGGRICLITSNADSRIGKIADCTVIIEHHRDAVTNDAEEFEIRQMMGEHKSFAPLGTLFETASMVFADAVISRMMEITQVDESALKNRHTNIE